MTSHHLDLSISLLSFNNKELLANCLNSIYQNTKNITFEILLVDNGSKDSSVQMVKKEFPKVKLIANRQNKLYIKGHNQNLKRAKGRYFLILNDDTYLPPQALEKMVKFMDKNKAIGIASCQQTDDSGNIDKTCSRFPHPIYEIFEISYIRRLLGNLPPVAKQLARYRYGRWNRRSSHEVDVVAGSFMIGKHQLLKEIGYFDDKSFLFFYGEPDYCLRTKKAGYKVFHNGQVKIIHYKSKGLARLDPYTRYRLSQHDLLAYFRKNFSLFWWAVIWLLLLPNWILLKLRS